MPQKFKSQFYKTLTLGKDGDGKPIKVYLFKNYSRFDNSPFELDYISVYRDRKGREFVVESGAGISQEKMEMQIKKYLKEKLERKGRL